MQQESSMICIVGLVIGSHPSTVKIHKSYNHMCTTSLLHFRNTSRCICGEGFAVHQKKDSAYCNKIAIFDNLDEALLYFNKIIKIKDEK